MTDTRFRDRPDVRLMVVALGLAFVALALMSDGTTWFSQAAYLLSCGLLAVVARLTWAELPAPYRFAAVATLGGLASTALFAATELGVVDADAWQGVAVLVPPAWLFTSIGWVLHMKRIHTLRWVVTLVQLSFTALGAALFGSLAARNEPDSLFAVVGYSSAALVGTGSVLLAVIGSIQRIRMELAKRQR